MICYASPGSWCCDLDGRLLIKGNHDKVDVRYYLRKINTRYNLGDQVLTSDGSVQEIFGIYMDLSYRIHYRMVSMTGKDRHEDDGGIICKMCH